MLLVPQSAECPKVAPAELLYLTHHSISQFVNLQAVEARRECAKALKLVEDKEEEIEYYIKQLEVLREKNGMLRTQLDMEQQCKEAEVSDNTSLSLAERRETSEIR